MESLWEALFGKHLKAVQATWFGCQQLLCFSRYKSSQPSNIYFTHSGIFSFFKFCRSSWNLYCFFPGELGKYLNFIRTGQNNGWCQNCCSLCLKAAIQLLCNPGSLLIELMFFPFFPSLWVVFSKVVMIFLVAYQKTLILGGLSYLIKWKKRWIDLTFIVNKEKLPSTLAICLLHDAKHSGGGGGKESKSIIIPLLGAI